MNASSGSGECPSVKIPRSGMGAIVSGASRRCKAAQTNIRVSGLPGCWHEKSSFAASERCASLTRMPRRAVRSKTGKTAKAYDHKETEAVLRPDIGLQAQFKKKKELAKYRYDRSLDPQLSWDINADRERAESLIDKVCNAKSVEDAHAAAEELKRISSPFLNWAGKA